MQFSVMKSHYLKESVISPLTLLFLASFRQINPDKVTLCYPKLATKYSNCLIVSLNRAVCHEAHKSPIAVAEISHVV